MIKKTFIFRISGIVLFLIGIILRTMQISGSMPFLMTGIGLLIFGYVIWLYGTSKRKKISPNKNKETDANDS